MIHFSIISSFPVNLVYHDIGKTTSSATFTKLENISPIEEFQESYIKVQVEQLLLKDLIKKKFA